MIKKKIFFILLGLGLVSFSSDLKAGDEFFIDLSVLGDIATAESSPEPYVVPVAEDINDNPLLVQNNVIGVSSSSTSSLVDLPPLEPKFPVVEKKLTPKKNNQKPKAAKVVVPSVKPSVPADLKKDIVKAEVPKMVEADNSIEGEDRPNVIYNLDGDDLETEVVVEVDSDNISEEAKDEEIEATEVVESIENIETVDDATEVVEDIKPTEDNVDVSQKVIVYEFDEDEKFVVSDSEEKDSVVEDIDLSDNEKNSVDVVEEEIIKVDGIIRFEDDNVEINDADRKEIDLIIEGFEDSRTNRIGIVSYQAETSGISFKNRRLSMSRATNIRSYLITKGYKNFDIKLEVVGMDSYKSNSVEIIEIK